MGILLWSFILAYLLTSMIWVALGWDKGKPEGGD